MTRPAIDACNNPADIFAVFTLRNGQWVLWCTFGNRANADQECAYLVNMLDIAAKVFRRTV